jgi:hypothetical protein
MYGENIKKCPIKGISYWYNSNHENDYHVQKLQNLYHKTTTFYAMNDE